MGFGYVSPTLLNSSLSLTLLDSRRCLKVFEGHHHGQVQVVLPLPPEFEFGEDDFKATADHDTDTDLDDSTSQSGHSQRPYNHLHAPGARPCNSHPYHCARSSTPLTNPSFFPDDPSRPNPPQFMLTGALDSTIRLFHVPSGRCLRTFFGHLEGIWYVLVYFIMKRSTDRITGRSLLTHLGLSAVRKIGR